MTLFKRASIIVALTLLTSQHSFAAFSDVKNAHPNYTAIEYLQADGTLQGYEDGTFRPQNSVNRAEFLKIIIAGSNLPTDIENTTPFTDVNHEAWYGPYVKKAFHEGWINGYGDGTFRPEQTINKVEALKITAKAQKWPLTFDTIEKPFTDTPLDAWYIHYVAFAKANNLLETITETLNPAEDMTRGTISEIIYRTKINGIAPASEIETPTEETQEEIIEESTPILGGTISKNFFENITLNENLPDTFYKNEIYILSGKSNTNSDTVSVILENDTNKETLSEKTENGEFSIPITFDSTGDYQVGILNGSSGTTKAIEINIENEIPHTNTTTKPTKPTKTINPTISFNNDETKINFSATSNTLKKIIFTQNNKQITL